MKKIPVGAHTLARRVGVHPPVSWPPVGPPVPIFCYMKAFTLEKIRGKLTG